MIYFQPSFFYFINTGLQHQIIMSAYFCTSRWDSSSWSFIITIVTMQNSKMAGFYFFYLQFNIIGSMSYSIKFHNDHWIVKDLKESSHDQIRNYSILISSYRDCEKLQNLSWVRFVWLRHSVRPDSCNVAPWKKWPFVNVISTKHGKYSTKAPCTLQLNELWQM